MVNLRGVFRNKILKVINNMQKARLLLVMILLLTSVAGNSQDHDLDQMIRSINDMKDDTIKVNILIEICDSLYGSKPKETLIYATSALELAGKLKFSKGEAFALKYLGMGHYTQAEWAESINYFQRALEIFESLNYKKGISNMLNSIGVIYNNEGEDAKALENYIRSLKISEEMNDSVLYMTTLINIGLIYSKKETTSTKAEDYYIQALKIGERIGYKSGTGTATINLGELLFNKGDYNGALKYYEKALKIYRGTNDGNIPYAMINIGKIYAKRNDYQNSIRYMEDALKIARKNNAKLDAGRALLGLGLTYLQKGDAVAALNYFTQSETITTEIGALYEQRETYANMATAYSKTGDFQKAYLSQLNESRLKDSLFSETHQLQINQLRVRYEIESMLKENEILKRDAKLTEAKSKSQMIIIFFLVVGFISITFFTLLIARANNLKKKANEELNSTNKDLKNALDIVNKQKKQIEKAHEEITASINYAKYIQSSVLPKPEQIEECLGDHFILYKPKEIVSGDFYWVSETKDKTVVVSADCTGHGVPGAFMSMLGITLLNEIINKESVTNPGIILDRLRKEVTDSLKQKGERWEQKDGMDMALCTIDRKNMKLQFAGAINPLYIIRESESGFPGIVHKESDNSGKLLEIKGDHMPIGIFDEMDSFTFHEIDLQKGDTFYMFTDGFPDQFGGPDHKKFSHRRFREHLVNTKSATMSDQKIKLEKALDEWMGNNGQTDDISVIGFRIN
jgi:serine phosphatase RsbU (regulator of sigma subunit)/TPR repeat protein